MGGHSVKLLFVAPCSAGVRGSRAGVDLAAPAITVIEQLVIVDGRWVRKTPKTTAGRRRITLPGFLVDLLGAQLEERAGPGADGLVFPNRAGQPINPSTFNGNPLEAGQGACRNRWRPVPRP